MHQMYHMAQCEAEPSDDEMVLSLLSCYSVIYKKEGVVCSKCSCICRQQWEGMDLQITINKGTVKLDTVNT